MHYSTLEELLGNRTRPVAALGPVAVVFNEDGVRVSETITSLINQGFAEIFLVSAIAQSLPEEIESKISSVSIFFRENIEVAAVLNRITEVLANRWVFWCYNAEFLYFPHCETRSIAEVTTFMEEERRSAVSTQVVDLYSDDLGRDGDAVNLEEPFLDISGYYGMARYDGPDALPDQFDLLGGLKWRFEEHVPWSQRFIDRVSLFQATPGLEIDGRGLFNDQDYNTISCPWHNNLTIALASFRTAKALMHNPGSRPYIDSFVAPQTQAFDWSSQQLLELGFMEPGQWF